MSFEVVKKTWNNTKFYPPGYCTVQKNGLIVFHPDDLSAVGIKADAVILVDTEAKSLAIRVPLSGDKSIYKLSVRGRSSDRVTLNSGRVVKTILGLTFKKSKKIRIHFMQEKSVTHIVVPF